MRIAYEDWRPGRDARVVIEQANAICRAYQVQGYDLTLRQLYYQFVSRGHIANNMQSYKRLGDIINRARLAGLLDWNYIVDRTRNLEHLPHWDSPAEAMDAIAQQFRIDKWTTQPTRIEVWVEKEALAGVIGQVADRLDLAWFSCRGYVSQSEVWGAAQRLGRYIADGQRVIILHLGDHDPSGIDMTRDITARLNTFLTQDWLNEHSERFPGGANDSDLRRDMNKHLREPNEDYGGRAFVDGRLEPGGAFEVRRIALNFDQVQQYAPPPNPAKLTDSRSTGYIERFGDESWELDALEPAVLDALIEDEVNEIRDDATYGMREHEEIEQRQLLRIASVRWDEVAELLA